MQKSYILKFDKIQGDYVIVEGCQGQNQEEISTIQNSTKGFFFNRNFLKSSKKPQKNNEILQKNGFLGKLDSEINKNKADKERLSNSLANVNNNNKYDNSYTLIDENSPPTQTNPQPVPQPTPNPQPANPPLEAPPSNNVSVAEGVQLLSSLYSNFRILNMIYQVLRDVRQSTANNFSTFISDNVELLGAILNIYYSVSGQNLPPELNDEVPVLSDNFEDIVQVALARVQGMREVNLRLSKIFSVDSFNRQFNLIDKELSLQNDFLNNLRVENLSLKI